MSGGEGRGVWRREERCLEERGEVSGERRGVWRREERCLEEGVWRRREERCLEEGAWRRREERCLEEEEGEVSGGGGRRGVRREGERYLEGREVSGEERGVWRGERCLEGRWGGVRRRGGGV